MRREVSYLMSLFCACIHGPCHSSVSLVIPTEAEHSIVGPHKKARSLKSGPGSTKFYGPFEQTPNDSPWKLSQLFTEVLVGAPKYGSVTKSWRLYVKPFTTYGYAP